MTHDSSTLSSLRSLDSPFHVRTADSTSLPVHGRGTLSTSSFHVPSVAHVPRLTMQLISGGQIVDSSCRVILDFDSCSVQDRRTGALLGAGPRCSDGLWELEWLRLPSTATAASLTITVAAS